MILSVMMMKKIFGSLVRATCRHSKELIVCRVNAITWYGSPWRLDDPVSSDSSIHTRTQIKYELDLSRFERFESKFHSDEAMRLKLMIYNAKNDEVCFCLKCS